MIACLVSVTLPYVRAHALRLALTLLGIVIGIQGMVAVGVLNRSILDSFNAGVDVIAGNATLQIAGPETGVPESLAAEAQSVRGVQSAIAMIQGTFTTVGSERRETIGVFGVDFLEAVGARNPQFPREHVHVSDELRFLNSPDSIALGHRLLDRLSLTVGSSIQLLTPGGVQTFTVRGTLDDVGPAKLFAGAIALLDLPSAQRVLLAPGLVQTIYVVISPGESIDAVAERLKSVIGDRARVERTTARGQQIDAILGSLRVALSLGSLVTMLAGFFIIYQTLAISVEQRRRDIAIVRALGFTRRTVASVFLIESLLLGLLGAAGGIVCGYLLARVSLQTAIAGVNDMYIQIAASNLRLPFTEVGIAVALGLSTCLAAGLLPAVRAAREPPARVLRSTEGVSADRLRMLPVRIGIAIAGLAVFLLTADARFDAPEIQTAWIMLGHTLLIFGFAFLAPVVVWAASRVLVPLGLRAPLPISLATEFFARKPARAAATVSAIMVGYALVVVLGAVVYSIERTLGQWIGYTFASDVIVGTAPGLNSGTFDEALAVKLERLPGVAFSQRYRKSMLIYDGKPIVVAVIDRHSRPEREPLVLVESQPDAYDAVEDGSSVIISESFAFRFGSQLGDTLTLDTALGRRSFTVAAIARDYTLDLGTVIVDIAVYRDLWRDTRLTYLHLWKSPDASLDRLRASVAEAIGAHPHVTVVTNEEFKAEVQDRVGSLLRVLGSLRLLAGAIAILGVVNFLLAAVLDRKREIALLRSVGVTRSQIRQAVIVEAGLIGLTGASLGLLEGFPAAFFMVTHSMRIATSWTLEFAFPVALALSTLVAVTAAAAAAGYVPARRITAGTVLAGLQTE